MFSLNTSAWLKRPASKMMLASVLLGIVSLFFFGRLSYDLSFGFRPQASLTNLAVIYFDDQDVNIYGDGYANVSRETHARLLNLLSEIKAPLVFYDVTFDSTNARPEVDRTLADAIQRQGKTILVAAVNPLALDAAVGEEPVPPVEPFRSANMGFGHAEFDLDFDVVRLFPGPRGTLQPASWVAVSKTEIGRQINIDQPSVHWLNYYTPADWQKVPSFSFRQILNGEIPLSSLTNKAIFVGQLFSSGKSASRKDTFRTPYSLFGFAPTPGLMIHATAFMNLHRGDLLIQMPFVWQCLLAGAWPVIVGTILYTLSRTHKIILIGAALSATAAICGLSLIVQWHHQWWWSWLGPAVIQPGLALVAAWAWPKPDPYIAFISYRHEEEGATALLIHKSLSAIGYKTFIDVDGLRGGPFAEQLLGEIARCRFFIVILSPRSLLRCNNPDDWMLKELSRALECNRTIIPVFKDGFTFNLKDLPDVPAIRALEDYQGIQFSNKDFAGFVQQLKLLIEDTPIEAACIGIQKV